MAQEHAPRLEPRLFHPRYWGSWFGLGLLWLLVLLPWRSQMWLGRQLGTLARKVLEIPRQDSAPQPGAGHAGAEPG